MSWPEMFGTFALSVGAAVSINFFSQLFTGFPSFCFLRLNLRVFLLFLGGDGILGKMGS